MKVYFTQSHRLEPRIVECVVNLLESLGFKVILRKRAADLGEESLENSKKAYKQNSKSIKECSFVIAEGSYRSIGFGIDLAKAIEERKPVIYLYNRDIKDATMRASKVPSAVRGSGLKHLIIKEYEKDNLEILLKSALSDVKSLLGSKFNFILTADQDQYLEWTSKELKLSKSDILRNMIENSIEKDSNYKKYLNK